MSKAPKSDATTRMDPPRSCPARRRHGPAAAGPAFDPHSRPISQGPELREPQCPAVAAARSQPDINISVNVNARNLAATDFEVELHLDAKATAEDKVVFAAELVYAGTFRLENFPQQMLHPAVLIECPRLLFPFARQILAEATRNGGFPPLMLDPIDFAAMYQRRMQQQTVGQA